MKKYLFKNQKGFSLIEALVAMAILAVGLLAVGLMQIGAMKGNTNAMSRSDGVEIAQSVMDRLRSVPLDDTLLSDAFTANGLDALDANADHNGSELYAANPVVGPNGQTYSIFWNVLEDTPVASAKTVRVYVLWTDQKFGQNRAIMTSVLGGLYL